MCEADMKCKVAFWHFQCRSSFSPTQATSLLLFFRFPATLTRSRKLAAEGTFCCELNHSVFSLQGVCMLNQASARDIAHHVGRKMSKQNSQQKNFEGKMTDHDGAVTSRLLPSD